MVFDSFRILSARETALLTAENDGGAQTTGAPSLSPVVSCWVMWTSHSILSSILGKDGTLALVAPWGCGNRAPSGWERAVSAPRQGVHVWGAAHGSPRLHFWEQVSGLYSQRPFPRFGDCEQRPWGLRGSVSTWMQDDEREMIIFLSP